MPRSSRLPSLAVLLLAAAFGAAPAAVSAQQPPAPATEPRGDDTAFRLPIGQVEHTASVVKTEGRPAAMRHERVEAWLSRYRSRTVVTDADTGRRLRETAYVTGEWRSFDAKTRTLRIQTEPGRTLPTVTSLSFQAALQRWELAQGHVQVVGETTVDGRRALRLASTPGADDVTMTATIDAETYALHERRYVVPGSGFTQTETVLMSETLPATPAVSARVAMTSRKRLRVRRVVRLG